MKEKMSKDRVTKIFLPSIEKARIELYFTNSSVKPLVAQHMAKDGRTRVYRFGRLCINVLPKP